MYVLITGGAGFIGSHLAAALIGRGHAVTALDTLSPQIHGDIGEAAMQVALPGVTLVKGDVRDRDLLARLLAGHDAIVHLAAETGTGQSMYEIERYVDVNTRATGLLLDLIVNAEKKPSRVVVASSRAIYGEGAGQCPTHGVVYPGARSVEDMSAGVFEPRCPRCGAECSLTATPEDAPARPSSVYGLTKLDQELMVLMCCESVDVPAIALRYQNVYGPGQSLKNPYTGILSIFSTAILSGQPIRVFEDGEESRDFVHVADVVQATVLAIEAPASATGVFNVGAGEAVSVLEVTRALAASYDREAEVVVTGEFRKGDIRHNVADLTRIRQALGFEPKWSFERGLKTFTDWVQGQPVETSGYARSLDEMRERGLLRI
ncbi:MAG: NAD-dependent epimerase/dehydratase family protein [Caulobacter sp.]|nr:NAD-dependent epimerase/dehydratase family protein [Caulobacter sp.]